MNRDDISIVEITDPEQAFALLSSLLGPEHVWLGETGKSAHIVLSDRVLQLHGAECTGKDRAGSVEFGLYDPSSLLDCYTAWKGGEPILEVMARQALALGIPPEEVARSKRATLSADVRARAEQALESAYREFVEHAPKLNGQAQAMAARAGPYWAAALPQLTADFTKEASSMVVHRLGSGKRRTRSDTEALAADTVSLESRTYALGALIEGSAKQVAGFGVRAQFWEGKDEALVSGSKAVQRFYADLGSGLTALHKVVSAQYDEVASAATKFGLPYGGIRSF